MCTIESSYSKVGVGQTLKQHLEYFRSYKHFSKLKCKTQTWDKKHLTKYNLTLTLQKVKLRKRSVLLKGLTLMLVWAKY